jgi:hypothetical protein
MNEEAKCEEYRYPEAQTLAQMAERQESAEQRYFKAQTILACMLTMGRALECPDQSVKREAVGAVLREAGVDLRPMLAFSLAQNERWLGLSALRAELGVTSEDHMNEILKSLGLQNRIAGEWVPAAYREGSFWRAVPRLKGTPLNHGVEWNLAEVRALLDETDSAEDDDDAV